MPSLLDGCKTIILKIDAVFSVDVLECDRCGGRMRILAAIHPPEAIRKILECLGLPSRPPPLARPERIDDLDYA